MKERGNERVGVRLLGVSVSVISQRLRTRRNFANLPFYFFLTGSGKKFTPVCEPLSENYDFLPFIEYPCS